MTTAFLEGQEYEVATRGDEQATVDLPPAAALLARIPRMATETAGLFTDEEADYTFFHQLMAHNHPGVWAQALAVAYQAGRSQAYKDIGGFAQHGQKMALQITAGTVQLRKETDQHE